MIREDGYSDAIGLNRFKQLSRNHFLDDALYCLGGLAARVVDIPADAAISRSVEIENDSDSVIFNEIERLEALPKMADAIRWARLFGGSAILLLTDDKPDLREPLNIEKITRINELKVFDLTDISQTTRRYLDPTLPNYGQFETYYLNLGVVSGSLDSRIEVHESRLIFFGGDPLPRKWQNGLYWVGRSAVTSAYGKIRHYLNALNWSDKILERKQQPVHKMKGLSIAIENNLEEQIRSRISLVEKARNLMNSVVVDTEDDYEILNSDLSGVVDVIDEFKISISADTNIPVAILFGQSAKGMNATGKSDFESFYDLVEGIQQNKLKPALERLIELIVKQTGIKAVENWHISFPPLNTPTSKEKAETEKLEEESKKLRIERLSILVEDGVISNDEMRKLIAEEYGL